MNKNLKPAIGVVFLSSGWFYDVGIQNVELSRSLSQSAQEILKALSSELNIIFSANVHSKKLATDLAFNINDSQIDMLLVCHLTWVEDQLVETILDNIKDKNLLIVHWCFNPFDKLSTKINVTDLLISSGGVGVLQCGGLLKRKQFDANLIFGTHKDTNVVKKAVQFAHCAAIKSGLKKLNIGLLPYSCDLMKATYVDEQYMKNAIGPSLKYISVEQYSQAIDSLDETQVQDVVNNITAKYSVDSRVTKESLIASVRASLAVDYLASKLDLGAIAINDLSEELHKRIGLRPGLRLPGMYKNQNLAITMEGDVAAAIAMYITGVFTGTPSMYSEPLTYDIKENILVMGHAGLTDASLAAGPEHIKIITDYEYQNADKYPGAANHFLGRKGRVTLLNCTYTGNAFQFIACRGESIGQRMILDEGYSHLLVKLDIPLGNFFQKSFEAGTTQHWAVAYGDLYNYIDKLPSVLPIELLLL